MSTAMTTTITAIIVILLFFGVSCVSNTNTPFRDWLYYTPDVRPVHIEKRHALPGSACATNVGLLAGRPPGKRIYGPIARRRVAERYTIGFAPMPFRKDLLAMVKDGFFVLTGAFGSGKSTLLEHLKLRGLRGIVEPARPILAEQRSVQGNGLPEKDPRLFVELMFSRMLDTYQQNDGSPGPILFDRGIPDILGYAALFGFDFPPGEHAARLYRYNRRVFMAPAWEEIYCTDNERRLPFSRARDFGDNLRHIYERLGYSPIDLPLVSVEERAEFIRQHLRFP
jgi:predicted ATPase